MRGATISSSIVGATRVGDDRGRLDWGLSPSSPSSRWRAISSYSQLREMSWDSQTLFRPAVAAVEAGERDQAVDVAREGVVRAVAGVEAHDSFGMLAALVDGRRS